MPKKYKKQEEKPVEKTALEKEQDKLNQILGSSVEAAFRMAVDGGATVAGSYHPASKRMTEVARVDSLPEIKPVKLKK